MNNEHFPQAIPHNIVPTIDKHRELPGGLHLCELKYRLAVLEHLNKLSGAENSSYRFFSILQLRYAIFSVMTDEEKGIIFEIISNGLKKPLDDFAHDYIDFLGRFYFCANAKLKAAVVSLACSTVDGLAQDAQLALSFTYFSERIRFSAGVGEVSLLLEQLHKIAKTMELDFVREAVTKAVTRLQDVHLDPAN